MDDAIAFLEKRHGSEVFVKDDVEKKIDRVKTGLYEFDKMIGGGIPVGRIIEFFGPEGGGKTTLAKEVIKAVQTRGKKKLCLYEDFEQAIDLEYAEKLGVNLDKEYWMFTQPTSLEEGADVLGVMAYTGKVGLAVVDSVAAMTPKAELEGEMGKDTMGGQARGLGKLFRKLTGAIKKNDMTTIFINQVRDKIGVMWGNPETTPGGRALKFYASLRVRVSSRKSKDVEGAVEVDLKVIKNKTSMHQGGKATYLLIPGKGFMKSYECLKIAVEEGIIKEKGRSYILGGKKVSKEKMLKLLEKESLRKLIYSKMENE